MLELFIVPFLLVLISCKDDSFKLEKSDNDMYIYRVTNEPKNTKLSNDDKEYIINEINDLDFNYVETETIYGHI